MTDIHLHSNPWKKPNSNLMKKRIILVKKNFLQFLFIFSFPRITIFAFWIFFSKTYVKMGNVFKDWNFNSLMQNVLKCSATLRNLAVFTVMFLQCIWPFCDVIHERVKVPRWKSFSVIRQKGKSQNGCYKTKHVKFSEKQIFLIP